MTDRYERIRQALEGLRERCAQEVERITGRRRAVAAMINNEAVKPCEVAVAIRKIDVQQYYECALREIELLVAEWKRVTAAQGEAKARAVELEEALREWWSAHRPVGWTEDQHRACPHVNLATATDRALAEVLLRDHDQETAAPPSEGAGMKPTPAMIGAAHDYWGG